MERISSGTSSGKRSDDLLGYICCPFHDDRTPSFALYTDHAYCYGCGAHETAAEFHERTGVTLESHPIERQSYRTGPTRSAPSQRDIIARVHYWHRTLLDGPRSPRSAWFHARGFTDYQIQRFRFGHTGDHFVIPIINDEGIIGYKWRADPKYCDPNELRYKNPYGQPTLVHRPQSSHGPIVITEGELDANLLASLGYDAITTTSGSGSISQVVSSLRASGHLREAVYVATDPDTAGEKAARDLAQALPRDPYRVVWDTGGDISDYLLRFEPLERHKEMRNLIDHARPYAPEASRG